MWVEIPRDEILTDGSVHKVVGKTPLGVGRISEARGSRHKTVGCFNGLYENKSIFYVCAERRKNLRAPVCAMQSSFAFVSTVINLRPNEQHVSKASTNVYDT